MSDLPRRLGVLVLLLVALALPLVLEDFWLQLGLFVMATAIGAVGLTLLVGVAGQLSLGHAAFAAIGAYVYVWATSAAHRHPRRRGPARRRRARAGGRGGRVRRIRVLPGRQPAARDLPRPGHPGPGLHRPAPAAEPRRLDRRVQRPHRWSRSAIGGFSFSNKSPDYLAVAGVEFQGLHRLWYLFLVLILLACWLAANLRTSRRARWANVRDSETAAAAMGIAVARHKASAFVVSSGYAGLAGALLALAYGRLSPDVFTLTVSVDFLVMIVLGGLGSVGGAMVGALFVTALPLVLTQYSARCRFLAAPGSGGLDPATASRLLYGLAIIAVLLFLRGGLAGAFRRLRRRGGGPPVSGAPDDTPTPPPRTTPATRPAQPLQV